MAWFVGIQEISKNNSIASKLNSAGADYSIGIDGIFGVRMTARGFAATLVAEDANEIGRFGMMCQ
jgi:hypothetical protein